MSFPHMRLGIAVLTAAMATGCDTATAPLDHAGTDAIGQDLAAVTLVASGLEGASGSAIGPGGALFVTEGALGRITRIDPRTGATTTFATGLPQWIIPLGGVIDVAFVGSTAYALVTLVGPDLGGNDVVGIYRIDGPDSFTVIADIGAWSMANPPDTDFFVPTGLQYAIEPWRGAFLVTDGHHNRVLHVTLDGEITEFRTFDNIVPTGLAISGNTIYMAEAGPVPHLPQDGRIVAFQPGSDDVNEIAVGGRLLVDVELGRGRTLFGLSQGVWDQAGEGSPALPSTGSLLRADGAGGFVLIADGLDRPTSMQIIGNTAWIVTLGGDVVKIDDIAGPPFGTQ